MKLVAFQYGRSEINEAMVFENGDKNIKYPISLLFFLLKTDNKKILVDTGCDGMKAFPTFDLVSPVLLLEEYGVNRDDITDIILTHTHGDHIGGVKYYKNADIYVHNSEISAKPLTNKPNKIIAFDDECKINDNITVKHIGGHCSGSSIVTINYNEEIYVLCGDECYSRDNLTKKIPTGSSINLKQSSFFVNEYSKDVYKTVLFHDLTVVGKTGFKEIF